MSRTVGMPRIPQCSARLRNPATVNPHTFAASFVVMFMLSSPLMAIVSIPQSRFPCQVGEQARPAHHTPSAAPFAHHPRLVLAAASGAPRDEWIAQGTDAPVRE